MDNKIDGGPVTGESMEAAKEELAQMQIDKLAKFLMEKYPNEIRDEGAVDMAIRLLWSPALEESTSIPEAKINVKAEVIKGNPDPAEDDEDLKGKKKSLTEKIRDKSESAQGEGDEPFIDGEQEPSDVVEHGEAGKGLADPPPPGVMAKVQVREPKANLRDGPDAHLSPRGFLLEGDMAFAMDERDFDKKSFYLLSVPQFAGDAQRGRPADKKEGWVLKTDVEVIQG